MTDSPEIPGNSSRKSGRIGLTLIITVVLLAIVPGSLLVSIVLNQASDEIRNRTIDRMQAEATVKASDIEHWLDNGQTTLALVATREDQRSIMVDLLENPTGMDETVTNSLIEFFESQLAVQNTFSEFFIYDTEGLVRVSTEPAFSPVDAQVIQFQPYFEYSLIDHYIQPPYIDESNGNLSMVMTYPLRNADNDIVGVFTGQVRLEELASILTTDFNNESESHTYLGNRYDGLLLTPAHLMNPQSILDNRTLYTASLHNSVSSSGTEPYENYTDTEVIGVNQTLETIPVEVIVEIETEQALGTLNDLRLLSIVATVAIAIIAVLAGLAVTLWITKPITNLRETAVAVLNGDYSRRANIIRNNEIGELADAFNTMTARLVHRVEESAEKNKALEEATRAAREATRLKSEFLATMSHELRTPMSAIIGFGDMLRMEVHGPLNDQQKDRLERLQRNANQLLALINDILDLSRIETGRMEIIERPFQPKPLINRLCAQMEILSDQSNLYFHARVSPELPDVIIGDEKRIEQVITNLLSNAFKFTEKGGVVMHVRIDREQNTWQIVVSDTGIGISTESLQIIFDEFRQVDGSSTRTREGTGLGLAITHRIMQMMNGQVEVESTEGKGSKFTVTLPLNEPENQHAALIKAIENRP